MCKIEVSVICNTYNHCNYIKQCLDSFLIQKTNFDFEILVHDDCSTDGTINILEEYEKKFPDKIKVMYEIENQYSKGVSITNLQIKRAKGKYIAFCEGDDYWNDPLKLQKQFDILENNPRCNMVAHSCFQIDEFNGEKKVIAPVNKTQVLSVKKVIKGGGAYVSTCSLFFRKTVLTNQHKFREMLVLDYSLQISGALDYGIYFLSDCMATYRFNALGYWTIYMRKNKDKKLHHIGNVINMLKQLNIDTHKKYSFTINMVILKIRVKKLLIRLLR